MRMALGNSRRSIQAALILSIVMAAACAVVEPPPGGPVDMTPPQLAVMSPDSGVTDVGELKTIRLTFSEKMDRTSAVTWLHFFPDQRISQTKWHGATVAEVILEYPLPPDTVIVVEVAAGMRDAHKVQSRLSRRFPIATGDSIPSGSITGVLIMADSAVTNAVVEMYDVPPDTLEYFQQPLVRRTVTDRQGTYRFDWLPVPGGPWLVRAFTDPDNNLRPGDKDAQRLLPDTLFLTGANPTATSGVATLYAWNAPGRILAGAFASPEQKGTPMAWTLAMAEDDTGWVPTPHGPMPLTTFPLDPASGGVIGEVVPGLARVILFLDVDGDSTFSIVPDTLLAFVPDSLITVEPDSTFAGDWFLEPWVQIDGIEVDPGMESTLEWPDFTYTLTPWTAPEPKVELPDSLGQAVSDTLSSLKEKE
jgi:hypothetical protein